MVTLTNENKSRERNIYIDPNNINEKKIYKFLCRKNIRHGLTLKDKFENTMFELSIIANKFDNYYIKKLLNLFSNYDKINLKKCYKISKINNYFLKISWFVEEIERYILTASLFLSHFIWQNYNIKINFNYGSSL